MVLQWHSKLHADEKHTRGGPRRWHSLLRKKFRTFPKGQGNQSRDLRKLKPVSGKDYDAGDSVGAATPRTDQRGRQRLQEQGGHSRGLLLESDQGHHSRLARPSFKQFTYSCRLTHGAPRENTVSPNNTDGNLSGLAEAAGAPEGGTEVIKSGQAKKPGFLGLHAEHHAGKGAGGGEKREAGREGAPRGQRPRSRGTWRRGAVCAGKTGTGLKFDRKAERRLPE